MIGSTSALPLDLAPMEADVVEELPSGDGWQYEPKYDGFRCLAHVRSGRVHLQSKNRKPLERYFPEVVAGLARLSWTDFVLDGELVITTGGFEALQLRLHPAESRIRKLSEQTSAQLVAFDLLEVSGSSLIDRPLEERRAALAAFMDKAGSTPVLVSDRSYRALTFTPEGVGLRPFSVSHVAQPWRTAREPGDLTIRWTRRSRALAADSWTAPEVPLAEETEVYEVQILDGATVLRTLATATTSVTYTAALQVADWSALLGPGDTLDVRIYQLSALVGRGAPKSVTLQF